MGVDTAMIDIQRKVMRESLLEDVKTEIEMAREGGKFRLPGSMTVWRI